MKILICLLATACVCNASLLNLFGGKDGGNGGGSHVTYNVAAEPSHDHGHTSSYSSHNQGHYQSHGFRNSPQVIKVILDQGHIGGQKYGSSCHTNEGETKIFKVISQNSAGPIPVHVDHGYSAGAAHGYSAGADNGYSSGAAHGWSSGPSYATGYSFGGLSSYNSELNAILPQILQLILQNDDFISGGGNALNSQLISHFGNKGKAVITRSNGKANSYSSGGHVVQKGHLQITRIKGAPVHSAPVHGPPAKVYYSHGPPVHGPPSHGHGW